MGSARFYGISFLYHNINIGQPLYILKNILVTTGVTIKAAVWRTVLAVNMLTAGGQLMDC